MVAKNNKKNGRNEREKNGKNGKGDKGPKGYPDTILSSWAKRWIRAIVLFLVAIIVILSFPYFNKAGYAGQIIARVCDFLIGKAFYAAPLFLFVAGLISLKTRKRGKNLAMALAILVSLFGMAGVLAVRDLTLMNGGWVGLLSAKLFAGLFGFLVANIIFGAVLLIGLFIFLQFVWQEFPRREEQKPAFAIRTNNDENVKIKGLEQENKSEKQETSKPEKSRITLFKKGDEAPEKAEIKKPASANKNNYVLPPLDLLNKNEAAPTSGNIKENSMIIKNTLENFGIPVEMAEVNIGPTVTQYAFKPAEGEIGRAHV